MKKIFLIAFVIYAIISFFILTGCSLTGFAEDLKDKYIEEYVKEGSEELATPAEGEAEVAEDDEEQPGTQESSLVSYENDFTLMDLNGNEVSLSDFAGKIVVLNFWATWCPPCREEIPDFVAVCNEYKDRDVQFIGISDEDVSTLRSFAEDYNINYPILIDNAGVIGEWGIRAIPTTFILNKDGKVIFKNIGMMTREQLENNIEDAL